MNNPTEREQVLLVLLYQQHDLAEKLARQLARRCGVDENAAYSVIGAGGRMAMKAYRDGLMMLDLPEHTPESETT